MHWRKPQSGPIPKLKDSGKQPFHPLGENPRHWLRTKKLLISPLSLHGKKSNLSQEKLCFENADVKERSERFATCLFGFLESLWRGAKGGTFALYEGIWNGRELC